MYQLQCRCRTRQYSVPLLLCLCTLVARATNPYVTLASSKVPEFGQNVMVRSLGHWSACPKMRCLLLMYIAPYAQDHFPLHLIVQAHHAKVCMLKHADKYNGSVSDGQGGPWGLPATIMPSHHYTMILNSDKETEYCINTTLITHHWWQTHYWIKNTLSIIHCLQPFIALIGIDGFHHPSAYTTYIYMYIHMQYMHTNIYQWSHGRVSFRRVNTSASTLANYQVVWHSGPG